MEIPTGQMTLSDYRREAPGIAHLEVRNESFGTPDEAAIALGVAALGDSWRMIDRGTAERVLIVLLREDLAYNLPRLGLGQVDVVALTDKFLSSFSPAAGYFTNAKWEEGARSTSWIPATAATFDGGVLVVDSECSGILWMEDED